MHKKLAFFRLIVSDLCSDHCTVDLIIPQWDCSEIRMKGMCIDSKWKVPFAFLLLSSISLKSQKEKDVNASSFMQDIIV